MPLNESEIKTALPLLEEVPLFSSLKRKYLKGIADSAATKVFEAGETIARQGESGICFYLIMEGLVEVRRGKRALSKLGRGQFFGEMSLFDKQPRSADVVAVEKTKCLLLVRWTFLAFVNSHSEISSKIIQELVRRLRETDKSLSE